MASPTDYLLDTNILVHLIRGQRMARYVQARYGLNTILAEGLVSVISFGEVSSFALQRNWGTDLLTRMQALLDRFEPLDILHPILIAAYADIDAARCPFRKSLGSYPVALRL